MGKQVFITGASEGLGRCFAKKFASQGYSVTAVARNEQRLHSLIEELNASDATIQDHKILVADLSTDKGHELCVEHLRATQYDVLVNNAGFSYFGDFSCSTIEDELAVMKVNIECLMKLSHAYLEKARAGDSIINLSSLTYYLPTPIQASYVASKNWIASFSESLWYQSRKKQIYVQGLCPGIAKTNFIDRAGEIKYKNLVNLISVSPESVVEVSYKALVKRKGPIVIPGFLNQLNAIMMNLLPRKISVWLMGKVGDLAL